jgi:cytochrome P450
VATWELIDEALRRQADFSANLTGVLVRGDDGLPAIFEFPGDGADQVIATADEPSHRVHRALVQPRLAARRIALLEPRIRAWARQSVGEWLAAGDGDFTPVSEIVPARAVAELLGLPDTDVHRFRLWAMIGGNMLAGDVSLAQMAALMTETGRMAGYLGTHLEAAMSQTRADEGAPLLHVLARGVRAGAIETRHAIGIATVLFGAGGESTAALIGSAIRLLAEDPTLAEELRRSPELVPRFVEEAVRLEPPFKFHYRSVRRSCELGGARLEPGDRLMLLWASANRDAAIFEDPDSLRLDRPQYKHHMSFGRGAHFCVGAPLARMEARSIVEEVLARTRRIGLSADSPPVHAPSIFVRRLERLPIEVEPAA